MSLKDQIKFDIVSKQGRRPQLSSYYTHHISAGMGPRAFGPCPADGGGAALRRRVLVRADPGGAESAGHGCPVAVRVPGGRLSHNRTLLEDLHRAGDEGAQLWASREAVSALPRQDPKHWPVEALSDLCQGDQGRSQYAQVSAGEGPIVLKSK